MAVFNEPTQWTHPLGNNADVSTLPDDTPGTTGLASLQKLFQLINQTPLEAGGIAPEREDINALYKILGDYIYYAMNGGVPSYNNGYDYIPGRVVLYTDGNLYKCIQANDSSDPKAPTDTAYWSKITTLADVAGAFANQDLSNLSARGQALFTNKANKDFSNIDNTAKIAIARNSSPSGVYDSLTLGVSDTSYVAPSDGYVSLLVTTTEYNQFIAIVGDKTAVSQQVGVTNTLTYLTLPVRKGESFKIKYFGTISLYEFYFTYKVGSESEKV